VLLPELMTEASVYDIDVDDTELERGVVLLTWPSHGYRLCLDLRQEGLPLSFSKPRGTVKRKQGTLSMSFSLADCAATATETGAEQAAAATEAYRLRVEHEEAAAVAAAEQQQARQEAATIAAKAATAKAAHAAKAAKEAAAATEADRLRVEREAVAAATAAAKREQMMEAKRLKKVANEAAKQQRMAKERQAAAVAERLRVEHEEATEAALTAAADQQQQLQRQAMAEAAVQEATEAAAAAERQRLHVELDGATEEFMHELMLFNRVEQDTGMHTSSNPQPVWRHDLEATEQQRVERVEEAAAAAGEHPRSAWQAAAAVHVAVATAERLRCDQDAAEATLAAVVVRLSVQREAAERLREEQEISAEWLRMEQDRLRMEQETAADLLRAEQEAAAETAAEWLRVEHEAAQAMVARLSVERAAADVNVDQLRAEQEAVEAAAAVAAVAERLRLEEEVAYFTQRAEEARAQLNTSGVPSLPAAVAAPAPQPAADADETLCVLCLDAPKDHIIVPCGHQCVCGACAEKLKKARSALCPFCRAPINATFKVFVV
jgi:hypothetical protein